MSLRTTTLTWGYVVKQENLEVSLPQSKEQTQIAASEVTERSFLELEKRLLKVFWGLESQRIAGLNQT